jgi:hypothetical protein
LISPASRPCTASRSDGWSRILDGSIAAFAVWAIYCHALVGAGASFSLMLKLCWVPLLALLLLLRHLPRLSSVKLAPMTSRESTTDPIRLPRPLWLAGAAMIVASYILGAPYFVFWLATLAYLAALVRFGTPLEPQVGQTSMELPTRWSNVIVVLLMVSAVTITLVSHRPDIDDAF